MKEVNSRDAHEPAHDPKFVMKIAGLWFSPIYIHDPPRTLHMFFLGGVLWEEWGAKGITEMVCIHFSLTADRYTHISGQNKCKGSLSSPHTHFHVAHLAKAI